MKKIISIVVVLIVAGVLLYVIFSPRTNPAPVEENVAQASEEAMTDQNQTDT